MSNTYELGALESSVSNADIVLALPAHTVWPKLGGLKQKLKKIPIKHSHRETYVQLASCIPQPKAGILPLLPTLDPGQLQPELNADLNRTSSNRITVGSKGDCTGEGAVCLLVPLA